MNLREAMQGPKAGDFDEPHEITDGNHSDPREPGEDWWRFVRESRRRLIRVEERLSIMMKVILAGFISLLVTILGGLALQLILMP